MRLIGLKTIMMIASVFLLVACQSAYYGALEKVGVHKRDIMVSRMENARDSQQEAKQQFKSALEQFQSVVSFDGGNLENMYSKLDGEYQDAKQSAEEVTARIDSVASVSDALFEEWQEELNQYTNANLKRKSAQQLSSTKRQYSQVIRAMRRAEKSMQPVLNVFKDQVLYLKHNLNAQAVNALESELKDIQSNVSRLVEQMNQSIKEADNFIQTLEGSS